VEELISNIEVAIKNLDIAKSEEMRQDIAKILRTYKPPTANISIKEKRALNNLRKNKNIVILKADKGNTSVIMNIIDYDNKMEEHLNKSGCYKIINKDPSEKIMREVIKKVKESSLDDIIKKKIIPNSSIIPRIYGAPKVHKPNIPLRPIVNTIGSPSYLLAKHLAKKLRPLSGNTLSYIKDSCSFVRWINNIEMKDEDLMVSFDIVSLYTMIPIGEAIEIRKNITHKETVDLLEV